MTEDFFSKHKEVFLREAGVHIDNMNKALLKLEKKPNDTKLLHEIFQAAHTLKSVAATMSFNQSAQLCHAIEDLLDAVRKNKVTLDKYTDLLFACFDFLSASIKEIANNQPELDAQEWVHKVRGILVAGEQPSTQIVSEQVIVSSAIEKIQAIEVKVDRLDALMKLAEELLVSRMKLDLLRESINHPELTAAVDTLGRLISDMQYNIMQVRLVPIGFIFNRFPRMVRDLAKQQKKEVDLQIEGGDIELDRSLIDEIGESLAHLIRNAVDHGLETVEVRQKLHKNPQGKILLKAERSKESVYIEVSDDGSGLNIQDIKNAATKLNILKPNASKENIMNLIFEGISTSKQISSVSGRGLGMSIVKQKIESIDGTIQVKSEAGKGTRFLIEIPLTLAVIKVLLIKVADQTYAVALNAIERLLMVSQNEFKGLLDYDAIIYADEDIPVTHLSTLFSMPVKAMEHYPIIVVRQGEERLGLVVDALLSTQDVVIKPLGKVVKENKFFSGSALIGSGEMILILDVDHLFLTRREHNEWNTTSTI